HQVPKFHRKPLSQLPFRPATEIGSRAFLRFSRHRAPRSDRPPGGARTKRDAALTKLHRRVVKRRAASSSARPTSKHPPTNNFRGAFYEFEWRNADPAPSRLPPPRPSRAENPRRT